MAWVVVCHVEMLGDGQSRCSESDRPEVLRYPVGQASLGFSYVYLPALLAMDGIYAVAGSAGKLLVKFPNGFWTLDLGRWRDDAARLASRSSARSADGVVRRLVFFGRWEGRLNQYLFK